MRKWWPVFLLIFLTPLAYLFNPDLIITPTLRNRGYENIVILIISGTVGTTEMLLWYLGWGGITGLILDWFKEDINFAKKIAGEMKRDGYIDGAKIFFTRKHRKLNEKADRLMQGLRVGSYFGFFWIGFWPTPGPRVIGDFICGTTRRKSAFFALCMGNFLKTAYLVFAWDKVFSWFGK